MKLALSGIFRTRRVRTRTRLQTDAVECGAAALGIILEYHGRYESAARLRELCRVSRNGSAAGTILGAARELGLDARAFSCDVEHLRRLPPPFIVFWNFDHYVVVEGFRGQRVYLNDPAAGCITVSREEFDGGFTGVVLAFQRTSAFRKNSGRNSCLRSLPGRMEGQWPGIAFVVLTAVALLFPSLIAGVIPKVVFDAILTEGAVRWLKPLLFIITGAAAALAALTWIQQRALAAVESRLTSAWASRFVWRVLHLPLTFLSRRRPGDLADCVSANDRVAELLAGELASNLIHGLLAGVYLAVMARYDTRLAATVLAIAVLNVLALRLVSARQSHEGRRIARERGRIYGMSAGALGGIETIKAMGSESEFFQSWDASYAGLLSSEQRLQKTHLLLAAVSPLLASISMAVVLELGGLQILDGTFTLGMLVAFQTLMSSFLDPFQRLVQMGGKLRQIEGDLARLDDVMESPAETLSTPSVQSTATRVSGTVELRGISFGHEPAEPLLENFSLSVPEGTRIALVGASGCGKSTVARLLAGLYRPWSGQVLVDGVPREQMSRHLLENSISFVDQEVSLFAGSIAANIALLDETLPHEALLQAARDAAIHDEIEGKPGAYAHQVEEGGRNLSFGQRQRIEIARALAIDPRVLILDEATSALDAITELSVLDNLRRRGCTCIVAAHRLSAIRECDHIVVLEKGRIVERGNHDDLVRAGGTYAALVGG